VKDRVRHRVDLLKAYNAAKAAGKDRDLIRRLAKELTEEDELAWNRRRLRETPW